MDARSIFLANKYGLLGLIVLIIIIMKYIGVDEYLTFYYIKTQQLQLQGYYEQHQGITIIIYFLIYIITTALSIPGATILTLLGGSLFGFSFALLVISFASTIGATLSFLISRFILKDFIEKRFASKFKIINDGVEKEGGLYLFSLRLVPVVPFFIINLAMGLTNIGVVKYFFISQLGMLAGTAVYVNAGVQLSSLKSIGDVMNFEIFISLAILGVFPLFAKKVVGFLRA
jgi:uncharacterized membrane protein YdjX (TVP38/TMEM64 family)